MTEAQTLLRDLTKRQSKDRQELLELSKAETLTDDQRSRFDELETRQADTERQLRGARLAVEADQQADTGTGAPVDAEMRERLELRSKARVTRFFESAMRSRHVDGAEAELCAAAGIPEGSIPFELWETRQETEQRAITPAPSTVGLNLAPLQPMVFAPSIAPRLSIDMPTVASGSYASGTITTAATAGPVAAGDPVLETAASFTVTTTTPHRIGASLKLRLEDVAAVGAENFESILRQHISVVISDTLDNQLINGSGTDPNISGIFSLLTDPDTPATGPESWQRFLNIQSSGIDGLWATELAHITLLAGVETYQLAAATFPSTAQLESAAEYMRKAGYGGMGFWTNSRMPATASHLQQGIICRKGRSMMPNPMRTAVCPSWGYFSIDDIYSGASTGERRFVINTLIGDLILVQPGAYAQTVFRVSE